MDETEELIRLCGRAIVAQMGNAPGFELHLTRHCVLGLSDEPLADFNTFCIGPDPEAEAFLTRAMARVRERGVAIVGMLSPHVAQTLAPVATRLGLTPAGTVPLMVRRNGATAGPRQPITVTRALGPELVGVAGDLAAAAFDLPRAAVARCLEAGMTEASGVETYIGWGQDVPMSSVAVTPLGSTAAITAMATPPQHQGKGMGGALLAQVIDDFRRRGVDRFFLTATKAGRPLYEGLGFEPVAELSAWISGPSAQAPR